MEIRKYHAHHNDRHVINLNFRKNIYITYSNQKHRLRHRNQLNDQFKGSFENKGL